MWKILNSPVIVAIIAVTAIAIALNTTKPTLATEIRGAYEELIAIAKDGRSDAEKSKAIQELVEELASQVKIGFQTGFSATGSKDGEPDPDQVFIETQKLVTISDIKITESQWPGKESVLYRVRNDSDKYLSQLRVNVEYFRDGELVACENEWISSLKFLEPGQDIALSVDRQLPKRDTPEEQADLKSDDVKIQVTNFQIKEL